MRNPSWGQHTHLDEVMMSFDFKRLPSEREWEVISNDREWLLEHPDSLNQLEERNREIIINRYGIIDDTIRSIGVLAIMYELQPSSVYDIVRNSLIDLRREVADLVDT